MSSSTVSIEGPQFLYRIYGESGVLLYVGIAQTPGARLAGHQKSKPWWGEVRRVTCEWFPDRRDVLGAEALAIIDEEPRYNRTMPTFHALAVKAQMEAASK